jgi:hypothetical protein
MKKIERFEDILAWQKARQLTREMNGFMTYLRQSQLRGRKFQ